MRFPALFIFVIISIVTFSQTEALSIGDKVPETVIGTLLEDPEKKVYLSEVKAKLLLLDFWSVGCKGCIYKMPELDSLKTEFGKDVTIVFITDDTRESIEKLFIKLKRKKPKSPIVIIDSSFAKLFPHKFIPHEVWIDHDSKVRYISGSRYVNRENFKSFLAGESMNIPVKNDMLEYHRSQPLIPELEQQRIAPMGYYSFIMGETVGYTMGGMFSFVDTGKGRMVRRFVNMTLGEIYLRNLQIIPGKLAPKGRIIYDTLRDGDTTIPSAVTLNKGLGTRICYEISLPISFAKKSWKFILDDLNRSFPYEGKIEKRIVKCYVLRNPSLHQHKNSLKTPKPVAMIKPNSFAELVNIAAQTVSIPFIDETGFTGVVEYNSLGAHPGLDELKKHFGKYGFEVSIEEREIEMVVIKRRTSD